ncbi:MAG: hypothetical protein H2184_16330 [Candidatus Galacturonibacter soehngenii]|nr:hypothetical protein [Candidatus Galacturonibacter soehngenii]
METTKHGLKKPDDEMFYDIEDFNHNTDILEKHLDDASLHVNATDIAQITEVSTLSQIDEVDTNFTMWGKVKKAISTLVSHISNVATGSTLGHIKIGTGIQMNSGTASVKLTDSVSTNDSTTALSAKAGKVINDSKAPTNHASTATTYGIGSDKNFGHIKLSDTYASHVGGVASAIGASQAALYNAYAGLNSGLNGKAPTNHASGGTGYGIGTSSAFGHVALSDNYALTSNAASGHAPSNYALANAYNTLYNKLGAYMHTQTTTVINTKDSMISEVVPTIIPNYTFTGAVVGFNVSGKNATYTNITECFYNGKNVKVCARALEGKTINVTVEVKLLYIKKL